MKMWSTLRSKIQGRRRRSGKASSNREYCDPPTVTLTDRNVTHAKNQGQTSQTSEPVSLSFLYALTRRWAWGAVEFRCETHPQEAQSKEQDRHGDTILHWACFGSPPVYVVGAILQTCPELAAIRNDSGFLPLHTACCYRANPEVIRALVQAYPEGAGMTIAVDAEQGRSTPLHLLCDYGCHADSMRAILETKAGVMSSRTRDNICLRTPLQILNERKNLNEFHSQLGELRRLQFRKPDALSVMENGESQDDSMETALLLERIRTTTFWEKTQLLVLAEYTLKPVTTLKPEDTTIIHALLGLKLCPPAILEFANMLSRNELMRKDINGDLPLHFACRCSHENIIRDILRAQPKAATVSDADGAPALKVYLERDRRRIRDHVIESLIIASPLAIEQLNIDRQLYPLIWSRLANREMESADGIDALFLSLQGNPPCFGS